MHNRKGSLFLEILGAFCLLLIILIPVLSSFSTGVRQTHTVKAYASAASVADYVVASAKAEIAMGGSDPTGTANVTADVVASLSKTSKQLRELDVTRTIQTLGSSLYLITVNVKWHDPFVKNDRTVSVKTVEGRL